MRGSCVYGGDGPPRRLVFVLFLIRPARKLVEPQEGADTQANTNDYQDGQNNLHEFSLNRDWDHSISGN